MLHLLFYWGLSASFFISDLIIYKTKKVDLYKQNKITPQYWNYCYNSMKGAMINQVFVSYPITHIVSKHLNYDTNDFIIVCELGKLLFYIFCVDIWFFTFHYSCHRFSFLYNKIHKFHHRISTTSAVSALDANPIEHLFVNIGAIMIGPFFFDKHIITMKVWVSLSTILTCIAHSGYKHYLVGEQHNLHHKLSKYNYGQGLYILDRIFGTYKDPASEKY